MSGGSTGPVHAPSVTDADSWRGAPASSTVTISVSWVTAVGNFRVAVDMLKQAVSAAKRLGNSELAAITTMNYAEALAGVRDHAQAFPLASAALEHFTAAGNSWRRVECLRLLGDIRRDRGEPADADEDYLSALTVATSIGALAEIDLLTRRRAALGASGGGS